MSVSVKSEVIELSDSEVDGSVTRKEHVVSVEAVRRSSRPRKVSTRFSPDDVAPAAPTPVKKAKSSIDRRKRRPSISSISNSSFGELELVDPQVLINQVELLKRKIRAGTYGIKMPIGPDEFVIVDGVDYLRNVGYSDFEEDGDENESYETVESFREDVMFEPQAVKIENEETEEYFDELSVLSESSVDVEETSDVDPLAPNPVQPKARAKDHNLQERARRAELSFCFAQLSAIVYGTASSKTPKVRVLSGAVEMIQSLDREEFQMSVKKKCLVKTNQELKQMLEDLRKIKA